MGNFSIEQLHGMSTADTPETFNVTDGVYRVRVTNVFDKDVNITQGSSPGLCAIVTVRHKVLSKRDSSEDMSLAKPVIAEFWGREEDLAKEWGGSGGSLRQYLREVLDVEDVEYRLGKEAVLGKEFDVLVKLNPPRDKNPARSVVKRILKD